MPHDSTLDALLAAAVDIADEQERQAYIERACAGDSPRLAELQALIRDHFAAGSLIDRPAAFLPTLDMPAPLEALGTMIGPYKLLEQIGEGGMGVVYLAEQKTPVRRAVALKIIKPGMDTLQVIARFESERQALAIMDHPNIAKVLDAGATEAGRPYFVMELVKGSPITAFCNEKRLNVRDRLNLMIPVCRAIQHAHQKGIIHRDIKPTNVIVAQYDGRPTPKVIDFGVAKATGRTLTDRTMFTALGQVVGTLEYMSPEQAGQSALDVDTRSDIYSLGVLLYELLTGTTPFDRVRLRAAAWDEMLRIIREEEPSKPSLRFSEIKSLYGRRAMTAPGVRNSIGATSLASVAAQRQTEPARLSREIRGDLDWVVMKALEKDRSRRYSSAGELATDVERYLQNQPIEAGPPSAFYRLGKYLRRNKIRIATALATLAGVVFVCTAYWFSGAREREQMQREQDRLSAVRNDVMGTLQAAKTAAIAGEVDLAVQTLSNATALLKQDSLPDLADQHDAVSRELETRRADAERYREFMRLAQEAQDRMMDGPHWHGDDFGREALRLFGVLDHDRWLDAIENSYLSTEQKFRAKEAVFEMLVLLADYGPRWNWLEDDESAARKSLEYLDLALKFHEPTRALHWVRMQANRALKDNNAAEEDRLEYEATAAKTPVDHILPARHGDHENARLGYRAALQARPNDFTSLFLLAERLAADRRFEESIGYFTGCLALRPGDIRPYLGRAEARQNAGDQEGARADFIAATSNEIRPGDRLFGLTKLMDHYWSTRVHQQEWHETRVRREIVWTELYESVMASSAHRDGMIGSNTREDLRSLHLAATDAKSTSMLERTARAASLILGPRDPATLAAQTELGWLYLRAEMFEDAAPLLKQTLESHFRNRAGAPGDSIESMQSLESAVEVVNVDKIIRNLQATFGFPARYPPTWETVDEREVFLNPMSENQQWVPFFLHIFRRGSLDGAISLLEETLRLRRTTLGPEHPETMAGMYFLGSAYRSAGNLDRAILVLEEAHKLRAAELGPTHVETVVCSIELVLAYLQANKHDRAAPLLEKAIAASTARAGPITRLSLSLMEILGQSLIQQREFGRAESRMRECVVDSEKFIMDSAAICRRMSLLADALIGQAKTQIQSAPAVAQTKFAEAEQLKLSAYESAMLVNSPMTPDMLQRIDLIEGLVELYDAWNKPEDAERWRKKLLETADLLKPLRPAPAAPMPANP